MIKLYSYFFVQKNIIVYYNEVYSNNFMGVPRKDTLQRES